MFCKELLKETSQSLLSVTTEIDSKSLCIVILKSLQNRIINECCLNEKLQAGHFKGLIPVIIYCNQQILVYVTDTKYYLVGQR